MARSSRNQILRLSGIPDGLPKVFQPHGFSREFSSRPETPKCHFNNQKVFFYGLKNTILVTMVLQRPCTSYIICTAIAARAAGEFSPLRTRQRAACRSKMIISSPLILMHYYTLYQILVYIILFLACIETCISMIIFSNLKD